MQPPIDGTRFDSIAIEGKRFRRHVRIRLDGEVVQRKMLSKAVCRMGTSSTCAKHVQVL